MVNLFNMKVFRELERGEHIVMFADPAEGSDYCAMVTCSKKHSDTPITFNKKMESPQFGYELEKIAKYVFARTKIWPTICVERNKGVATIHVLQELNYPDLFRMVTLGKTTRKQRDIIGWDTNGASRRKMLDDLVLAIRQKVFKIYDLEIISQMRSFTRHPRSGKPRAEYGKHDDLVISAAGAWQVAQLTPLKYEFEEEDDFDQERERWRFK